MVQFPTGGMCFVLQILLKRVTRNMENAMRELGRCLHLKYSIGPSLIITSERQWFLKLLIFEETYSLIIKWIISTVNMIVFHSIDGYSVI
jgi:hypothetical protein